VISVNEAGDAVMIVLNFGSLKLFQLIELEQQNINALNSGLGFFDKLHRDKISLVNG
jgi:hypothetical protein